MINRRGAAALCVALVAPAVAHAQSEVRFSADTAARAGYSNNPFSDAGKDNAAPFVELEARPRAELVMQREVISLEAHGRVREFLRKFSRTDSVGAALEYRGTQSARLQTHILATFDSAIVGEADILADIPGEGDGGTTAPDPTNPDDSDISLIGSRSRRNSIKISGDLAYTLGQRDSLKASAFSVRSRYDRFLGTGDYNGYGGSVGYSRQLTQFLQFGGQASYSYYLYPRSGGETRVTSFSGTTSARLNQLWTINGSLGVSLVGSNPGIAFAGASSSTTSMSGSLSACRTGPRALLCVTGSRSVRPTGAGGTQNVSTVGVNYRYRMSERETVSLRVDYSKNDGQVLTLPTATDYLRSKISYEKTLSQRLRLTGSLHYRDLYGTPFPREADFGATVGVSYRFGDPR